MTVIRVWNHLTGESYAPGEEPRREGKLQIIRDIPEYISPVNGKLIGSRSQRREDLKRTGCREVDPSENKWWSEKRKRDAADNDRRVTRAVEDTIRRLNNG